WMARAEDWPQFRGPGGEGHSTASGLPVQWSETNNVRWKTAIPGRGWSSPAVQGNRIWVTTSTEEGHSLRLVGLDRKTGKVVKDIEVFALEGKIPIHDKNSQASPTPILEGDRVYVHFGSHGTACVRTSGEIVWRTKL